MILGPPRCYLSFCEGFIGNTLWSCLLHFAQTRHISWTQDTGFTWVNTNTTCLDSSQDLTVSFAWHRGSMHGHPHKPPQESSISQYQILTQQLNNSALKTHFKFNLRKRKMFQYIKGCYRQFFKEGKITSICWKEFYLCPGVNELWLGRKAALTGRWGSRSHPQLDDRVSLSLVALSD